MIDSTKQQMSNQLQLSLSEKNYTKSLQLVQKIIDVDSQGSQNYKTKTVVLFNLNRFQDALEVSEIAVCKGECSIDFYNLIIKCHLQLDDLQVRKPQGIVDKVLGMNQPIKHFIQLSQAIHKIRDDNPYELPEKEQTILAQMKKWLYAKGANYDKVKIVTQQKGYRGGIATKSIKKDQTIVFIPKSELITLEIAGQNNIAKEIVSKNVQLLSPKHSIISVFLLEQKASGVSKFKAYLDILPADHSCFPINYSTQELMQCLGSPFLFKIREKVLDLKRDFDAICCLSDQFTQKYTFKEFCWARIMVGSRVFGVFMDGVKTQILAPFADMLNHKTPKQTVWNYSQDKAGFFIQTLKDINIGEELFDSYGKKCNSRFLLNYGFVLQNNQRNQICIKVDLNEKDPTLSYKIKMLRLDKQTASTKIFRITKSIEENSFFQLMGYLRFKSIEKIQTLNILQKISNIQKLNEPYKPIRTPPTTMEVELKIWSQLKSICQAYLDDYPHTLSSDQDKLKTSRNLTQNMRNILILRIGQKELYHHYLQIADSVLQIYSKGYVLARQTAQKNLEKDHCRYIQKILNLMPHQQNQHLKRGLKDPEAEVADQSEQLPGFLQEDDQISRQY